MSTLNVFRFLPVFFSLALVVSCSSAQMHPRLDGEHPIDSDELLVLDPPADYLIHVEGLGLEILDVTNLPGMGSKIYHLRILDDRHPLEAREHHKNRFPNVVVDAHHHYEHHAAKADKSYTASTASNWAALGKGCSKGIRVGVIDGVLDIMHTAFKGTKVTYRSFHLKGEKLSNSVHGTAVASVITGRGAWGGVLPGVEVMAANIFHAGKDGKPVGSAKSIVRAVDWMIENKVPIINASIGGGPNALIEAAVKHAASKGIVVIGSGGNQGPFSKKKNYPGAYPTVIAITSVDRFKRTANFASAGDYLEFATPGGDIWAAVPGGGKAMSGTSFSAPIFTAYAAAAMKHLGLKTTDELREFFKKNVEDTASPGRDRYTGWGIINLSPVC